MASKLGRLSRENTVSRLPVPLPPVELVAPPVAVVEPAAAPVELVAPPVEPAEHVVPTVEPVAPPVAVVEPVVPTVEPVQTKTKASKPPSKQNVNIRMSHETMVHLSEHELVLRKAGIPRGLANGSEIVRVLLENTTSEEILRLIRPSD